MQALKISRVRRIGKRKTIDIEVGHPDHNFYAEGLVSSNSHSIAYSALAAITVYLKINYPKEFYFACLKMAKTEVDKNQKILRIANEMKFSGIPLLPPSLILSKEDFSLEDKGIRYGLGSIKGISDKALENLKLFKTDGFNKFELFEAAKQAKINIGVLCALIQAGALGDFGITRSKLVLEAQLWSILSAKEKTYCIKHGVESNYDLVNMIKGIMEWVDDAGKPVARKSVKQTRLDTIIKNYSKYHDIYKQNSQYEHFANWWYERSLLGFSYSNSLKEIFLEVCPNLLSIEEFSQLEGNNSKGIVMGIVESVSEGVSKAKKRYTKLAIEDGTGMISAFIFDEKDNKPGTRTSLKERGRVPKKGQVAAFRGKKYEEIMILDDISPQDEKIFMGLASMKNSQIESGSK